IHANLAVYSIREYAWQALKEQNDIEIEIVEYTINQRIEAIIADLYNQKADVIAFSCYIWNIQCIKDLILLSEKLMPDTKRWLGGPEVSYQSEDLLKNYPVDVIMSGEGEATFLELTKAYLNGTSLQEVKGIITREGTTAARALLPMDSLPFPYDHLEKYQHRIIYYESSRGCPYSCSYCLSSIDRSVRFRSIDLCKQELQFFLDHQVKQVKFVDRTFNCNHQHAIEIWKYISEHDNGITNFHFEIAADILNEEEISILQNMRKGLVQLEIGVQTTNPNTITEIDRKMDYSVLKNVVGQLQKNRNLHLHLDLIAGLPKEDYESFIHSFNQVYELRSEQLQLGFLKVLKGSPMHERALSYGLVYSHIPPYEVLYTNWLTYEDLQRLKAIEEMVEVYYNSNQFKNILNILVDEFESPYMLYFKLSEFYRKKGYDIMQPSRIQRYHVLLEFVKEYLELDLGVVKEAMAMDLYLRENLKSRPSFLENQDSYKNDKRSLYQKENISLSKMTHLEYLPIQKKVILFDYSYRDPITNDARTTVFPFPE
ncbi:MAG: B12-binding domain-containing radical SAM protein, partial [Clostridia bacterium]|nr:B12-binding domain-containing radical SAM protein [Clostridia bacterium]